MVEPSTDLILERWVAFGNSQQGEKNAVLQRLSLHDVVFEHYALDSLLRTSEVLPNLRILFGGTMVYSGRAVVRNLVNNGPTVWCEAQLDEGWLNVDAMLGARSASLLERYNEFFRHHTRFHIISPEFTAAVAGLRNYLTDVRMWLEQVALGLGSATGSTRSHLERDTAWSIREPIIRTIQELFDRYEEVAQRVPPELQPAYFAYAQRQVRGLLLDAPFVFRTFRKPLGYAGDYLMVAMMFDDPCVGPSLFARILNCYSLTLPPILAHRNRIDYLTTQIEQETLRVMRLKRRARIYNLGCGPAREIQSFIARSPAANDADFLLVDFNQETLEHARVQLCELLSLHSRRAGVEFLQKSVQQILKEGARARASGNAGSYDLIYCAGLFDYLSDNACKHLAEYFWEMLAPGGLLILTNVDHHASRAQMECFLEWNLLYRDTAGMRRLAPSHAHPDDIVLKRDLSGVNILMEVRKPEHGH